MVVIDGKDAFYPGETTCGGVVTQCEHSLKAKVVVLKFLGKGTLEE